MGRDGGPDRVLDAVDSAAPWDTFSINDLKLVELSVDAAAPVYSATARRTGQDEYVAQ